MEDAQSQQSGAAEDEQTRISTAVRDATGIGYDGVHWIGYTLYSGLMKRNGTRFSSAEIVHEFIVNVRETKEDVETQLKRWHIKDSRDVGRVVLALVDHGLCQAEEDDTIDAFEGIFTTADIKKYMRRQKITPPINYYRGCCYVIGAAGVPLIFISIASGKSIYIMDAGWALIFIAWLLLTFEKDIRRKGRLSSTH